ncbi:hypothetical protein ACUN0C_19655 [Faunimonas sp. B44]|uniref:hypothetical protein n=1 Tax=Faunimonas sp. B44 TaxID=3461493 RepID=UPI004044D82B
MTVMLCVLAAALPSTSPAQPANVEAPAANHDVFLAPEQGWQLYVNGRFGTRVAYPVEVFSPRPPPENGDGRRFQSGDAEFEVFAWENADGDTGTSMESKLLGSEGYERVERAQASDTHLILSGIREGKAFHEHYVITGGTIQALGMEYPRERRTEYEPLYTAIDSTFLHGDEAAALLAEGRSAVPGQVMPDTSLLLPTGRHAAEPLSARSEDRPYLLRGWKMKEKRGAASKASGGNGRSKMKGLKYKERKRRGGRGK